MIIDGLLIVVLLISCYTDLRFQKIYNIVLFPAALLALVFHTGFHGLNGLIFFLKGAGLGLVLLILPYLLGGMGAGTLNFWLLSGPARERILFLAVLS